MSDHTAPDSPDAGPATAVATPPAPPASPPATGTAAPGRGRPRRTRSGTWIAVAVALLAVVLLAVVGWLVVTSLGHTGPSAGSPEVKTAFDSAMKKAGVSAVYPAGAPIELTSVKPTGSHTFSATFTPEEIASLMNTFSYTADVAAMQIAISKAKIAFPTPGTAKLDAQVTANGGSYAGSVTLPVAVESGRVRSSGVTELTVEGISANPAQKSQVGDALVLYANSLLSAAPGLKVDSASIEADGVHVSGSAPDSLSYP